MARCQSIKCQEFVTFTYELFILLVASSSISILCEILTFVHLQVMLNLWRLMRSELALYDYSFESIAFHLLHERCPAYDHRTLTNWFDPPVVSGVYAFNKRNVRLP